MSEGKWLMVEDGVESSVTDYEVKLMMGGGDWVSLTKQLDEPGYDRVLAMKMKDGRTIILKKT